jgi:hypothetical protein
VWWIVGVFGCYAPTPREQLPCSETGHCPPDQSCDPVFHVCASEPVCETPSINDAFEPSPGDPCTSWGHVYGNAIVDGTDRGLTITPRPLQGASGGCDADREVALGLGGVFVEVAAVLANPGGYTGFAITELPGVEIDVIDGRIEIGEFIAGSVPTVRAPYDPIAMRWWRLRPDHAAHAIIGEHSPDGVHWTILGTVDVEPPMTTAVQLSAGLDDDIANPGTSVFASFNLCPAR